MITKLKTILTSKIAIAVYAAMSVMLAMQLISSDAYYVNYVLVFAISAFCFRENLKNGEFEQNKQNNQNTIRSKKDALTIRIFSILFMLMVACSNYKMWAVTKYFSPDQTGDDILLSETILTYAVPSIWFLIRATIFLVGSYFAFWNIFTNLHTNLSKTFWKKEEDNFSPGKVFIISFIILVITRCAILFLSQYPGDVPPDGSYQIGQIFRNEYNNHHSFYHTMVIKAFINLGMYFTNSIDVGVATYCVFQIIFTSLCFSYLISTICSMKPPKWVTLVSAAFFIFMPYHITYAMTVWKDVMYGCFILLFLTSTFRVIKSIGNKIIDYIILALSGVGACLFRSNGLFVFILLTIAFFILWKIKYLKILIIFILTIALSFFLKYKVLSMLNIPQADIAESLSVPLQQIARTYIDASNLTAEERDTIIDLFGADSSRVMPPEEEGGMIDTSGNDVIRSVYLPYISDEIKNLFREGDDHDGIAKLKADPGKFIKLYLTLGLKHPGSYLAAWIDLTRGYWNAGYEYRRWKIGVHRDNPVGLKQTIISDAVNEAYNCYLWEFTHFEILKLFLSIGLFVWINLALLAVSIFKKDKLGMFVTFPVIATVISLLIATPVFAEFRYIYLAFCILPLVAVIVLRPVE